MFQILKKSLGIFSALLASATTANANTCKDFEGCADFLQEFSQSQSPVLSMNEDELESIAENLFINFQMYQQTSDFHERSRILGDMRSAIQVLANHDYLDSAIILLAGEVDSQICLEGDRP